MTQCLAWEDNVQCSGPRLGSGPYCHTHEVHRGPAWKYCAEHDCMRWRHDKNDARGVERYCEQHGGTDFLCGAPGEEGTLCEKCHKEKQGPTSVWCSACVRASLATVPVKPPVAPSSLSIVPGDWVRLCAVVEGTPRDYAPPDGLYRATEFRERVTTGYYGLHKEGSAYLKDCDFKWHDAKGNWHSLTFSAEVVRAEHPQFKRFALTGYPPCCGNPLTVGVTLQVRFHSDMKWDALAVPFCCECGGVGLVIATVRIGIKPSYELRWSQSEGHVPLIWDQGA